MKKFIAPLIAAFMSIGITTFGVMADTDPVPSQASQFADAIAVGFVVFGIILLGIYFTKSIWQLITGEKQEAV